MRQVCFGKETVEVRPKGRKGRSHRASVWADCSRMWRHEGQIHRGGNVSDVSETLRMPV